MVHAGRLNPLMLRCLSQKKLFAIDGGLLSSAGGRAAFAWHPKGLYLAAVGTKVRPRPRQTAAIRGAPCLHVAPGSL